MAEINDLMQMKVKWSQKQRLLENKVPTKLENTTQKRYKENK